MSDPGKAVFLSYASQDSEAAKKICEVLRTAGIEVWFDQSELRGGDSWDQKIRKQIKECALFVPVISANTQARLEGYFRLEWKLAEDRSHLMARGKPFIVPVCVDDTKDWDAIVPDSFMAVQWVRLPGGAAPASFAQRIEKLLSGEGAPAASGPRTTDHRQQTLKAERSSRSWLVPVVTSAAVALALVIARPWRFGPGATPKGTAVTSAPAESEARRLMARARAMTLDKYNSNADDFATAGGLLKQALALDQNDAEIWTFSSLFNTSMRTRGFDHAPGRRELATHDAERALALAPNSIAALFALGRAQRDFEPGPAEATFKKILARDPNNAEALSNLAYLYDGIGRLDEAAALYDRALAIDPAHAALNRYTAFLMYFHYRRFEDADRAIRQSIALQPSANSVGGLAMLLLTWKGDADGAAQALANNPSRNEPRTVWNTAMVQLCRRRPEEVFKAIDRLSDEYIQDNWFAGPKAYFAGRAHAMAGRAEAARVAWESALAITDERLKTSPADIALHTMRGQLLAWLARPDEALREARTITELHPDTAYWFGSAALIYAVLGRADDAMALLEKWVVPSKTNNVGWPLTPALLRIDPIWDKIRDDPRFQKLAASDRDQAEPATNGTNGHK